MSGGHFDWKQYRILEMADDIAQALRNAGTRIPKNSIDYPGKQMIKHYPEMKYYQDYSERTKRKFRKIVIHLRQAYDYVHNVDWLLSGDDGEEEFNKKTKI